MTHKNCQSCGMPLQNDPKGGGTELDGSLNAQYCSFCYNNGSFVGGDVSLKEFSKNAQKGMLAKGKSKFFAWLFSRPFMLSHLQRWKNKG